MYCNKEAFVSSSSSSFFLSLFFLLFFFFEAREEEEAFFFFVLLVEEASEVHGQLVFGSSAAHAAVHAMTNNVNLVRSNVRERKRFFSPVFFFDYRCNSIRKCLLHFEQQLVLVLAEMVGHRSSHQKDDLLLLSEHASNDIVKREVVHLHVRVLLLVGVILVHLLLNSIPFVHENFPTKALEERRHEFDLGIIEV